MNRYFLKVDPIKECFGAFGQSGLTSRWEGGEIAFKSKGPRYAEKTPTRFAPQVQIGDELWIWTHEDKGGHGLVARASAAHVDPRDGILRITLSDVALIASPFGFEVFKRRPDNGHVTGTRLLDYKSIARGTGVYQIEDDDLERFLEIVEKFGGGVVSERKVEEAEVTVPSTEFSWADEVANHEDELLSGLQDRRTSTQKARPGQAQFRDALRKRYKGRCVITKCAIPEALEAAHVMPHTGDPKWDHPDNGMLLRRDLHSLFDAQLWSIDPRNNILRVAERLKTTIYGKLDGREIDHQVAPAVLEVHFRHFEKGRANA